MPQRVRDPPRPPAGVRPVPGPLRERGSDGRDRAPPRRSVAEGAAGCGGAPQNPESRGEPAVLGEHPVEAVAAAVLWDVPLLLLLREQQRRRTPQ